MAFSYEVEGALEDRTESLDGGELEPGNHDSAACLEGDQIVMADGGMETEEPDSYLPAPYHAKRAVADLLGTGTAFKASNYLEANGPEEVAALTGIAFVVSSTYRLWHSIFGTIEYTAELEAGKEK